MDSSSGSVSAHRASRPCTPTNNKNITPRRNTDRDRELQQLKSRGVVSELNKTFDSHGNYLLTPASPPNNSSVNHSNRAWRKSTSSGTAELLHEGSTQISTTTTTNQRHMLYDDSPMASPLDMTPNTTFLRKAPSQDLSGQDVVMDNGTTNWEQNETALFHIDNHASLIYQYKSILQHSRKTENQLLSCQTERQQMENSTRQIVEKSLGQNEAEADKARQLSSLALKQDQVIHELEFALSSVLEENHRLQQQMNNSIGDDGIDSNRATQDEIVEMRHELENLRTDKLDYEKQIRLLSHALESSQQGTNKIAAMMEYVNEQCHQQQLQIDKKMDKMARLLSDKDDIIRKYQQENRYYSQLVDRSMDNIRSSSGGIVPPPTGPPPTSPLPALPVTNTQVDLHDDTIEEQHRQQQPSPPHDLTSDDEQDEHVLTPSMEMLLLQAPSTYCFDESTLMNDKVHQEYTEQLKNRLSINKEIDHLEVWDHAALEKLQQQQLKRTSLAPTTTTTTSSAKWSDISSSAFESDWDDKQGHSTFWKGMKKKLRV